MSRAGRSPLSPKMLGGWLLLLVSCAVLAAGAYNDFLQSLAQRESSGNSTIVNPFGYAGLYQMGEVALIDAGYYTNDNTDKNDLQAGYWTGKNGINSLDDFLQSPEVQKTAITEYHGILWKQISALDLDKKVGQTFDGVMITQSGLIAAAHLVGAGGLGQCLTGGKCTDANNTTAQSYLKAFGGYDVQNLTGSNPPSNNTVTDSTGTTETGTAGNSGSDFGSSGFGASTTGVATPPLTAFETGSGLTATTLKLTITAILVIILFIWTAYVSIGQFRGWGEGNLSTWDMQSNIMQAVILTSLLMVIFSD